MPLIPFEARTPRDNPVANGGKTARQITTEFGK
jgi:hypothetical protein